MVNLVYIDGSGHKAARAVKNREEYFRLRNTEENRRLFEAARGGDKKAKASQCQFTYNDMLPDGVLRGCCHAASTFAHDIDCGNEEECKAIAERMLGMKEEIGLLELTVSSGWGLHAVCLREKGKTILENQVRIATLTKTEMDTSTHDEQRVMFTGPATDDVLLFLDDRIFEETLTIEESAAEYQLLRQREKEKKEEVPAGAKKANKHYRPWEDGSEELRVKSEESNGGQRPLTPSSLRGGVSNPEESQRPLTPSNLRGGVSNPEENSGSVVAATEQTRFIAEGVMRDKGLERSFFLDEGARHNSVKVLLSGMTQLLSKAETNGVLQELMPDHWNDENIQKLVDDFYLNYTKPNQRLTRVQEQLFVQSRRMYGNVNGNANGNGNDNVNGGQRPLAPSSLRGGVSNGDGGQRSLTPYSLRGGVSSETETENYGVRRFPRRSDNGSQADSYQQSMPPEMPKRLPKLIQLLTSRTPDIYKPAVAHAVFPALATHLCGVSFRYTNGIDHEATLMNCLMAGTGAGKGCIDEPIRRIMADIKRRDQENERREAEWKKDCQKRGANKDKLPRPEGLVIQIIDADMTKPALVMRMEEAEGHFVYVKLNELDLFEQLRGQTGKQHFQLMCLAFDPDAEYGQTRVGMQSITGRPRCRFNWNACTTIQKGRRFFRKVVTDGPVSRINFCTIPEQEIGADQPVFGQYDSEFDEQLKAYLDRLVAARGLIDCPQAFKLAKKLLKECAEFARLSQSYTYWDLSHRACTIAWLKACVLYVANGQKWERSIEEFIRWSLNYDLWCKMQFFAADIERANSGDDARIGTRGPRNLLELLPDTFTMADARLVRQQQGMDTEKTGNMISTWKKRHYLVQMADGSFQKCMYLNNK